MDTELKLLKHLSEGLYSKRRCQKLEGTLRDALWYANKLFNEPWAPDEEPYRKTLELEFISKIKIALEDDKLHFLS